MQAADLPTNAAIFPLLKCHFKSTNNSSLTDLGGEWRQVDLDVVFVLPDFIRSDMISAQNTLTVVESKFPVVPVAGKNTLVINGAFGSRVRFVRTAIVDGKQSGGCLVNRNL